MKGAAPSRVHLVTGDLPQAVAGPAWWVIPAIVLGVALLAGVIWVTHRRLASRRNDPSRVACRRLCSALRLPSGAFTALETLSHLGDGASSLDLLCDSRALRDRFEASRDTLSSSQKRVVERILAARAVEALDRVEPKPEDPAARKARRRAAARELARAMSQALAPGPTAKSLPQSSKTGSA